MQPEIPTDEILMERMPDETKPFPLKYACESLRSYANNSIGWHWHYEFEFFTATRGSITCSVRNSRFVMSAGDGIFLNSGSLHRYHGNEDAMTRNILFPASFLAPEHSQIFRQFLAPLLQSDLSYLPLRREQPWSRQILTLLDEVYALHDDDTDTRELEIYSRLYTIWSLLFSHREQAVTMEKSGITRMTDTRVRQMTGFLTAQYDQKLTLEDIARAANISKSEALRCFHEVLETTPIRYLNSFRLSRAHTLLTTTDTSISDIADSTGFDSVSYFDRLFRQTYGQTPRAVRLQSHAAYR